MNTQNQLQTYKYNDPALPLLAEYLADSAEELDLGNLIDTVEYACRITLELTNITSNVRRYCIGKIFRLLDNISTSQVAEECGCKQGSVSKYGYYCVAIDQIYCKYPEAAFALLKETYAVSSSDIMLVSQMTPDQIRVIHEHLITKNDKRFLRSEIKRMSGIARPLPSKSDVSRFGIQTSEEGNIILPKPSSNFMPGYMLPEILHPGKDMNPAIPTNLISSQGASKGLTDNDTPAIKKMYQHDPDAEVSSLSLTIPTWISSIRRVKKVANIPEASPKAKWKLNQKLCELKNAIDNMMEYLEEDI